MKLVTQSIAKFGALIFTVLLQTGDLLNLIRGSSLNKFTSLETRRM
jgi:hypothetical protein